MGNMPNIAEALNNAVVFVDWKQGPSTTTYTLTGHMDAVRCKVESLFREFNPFGYGSRVEYTPTGAVFTRSNSCD